MIHAMILSMANLCGEPSSTPEGAHATSNRRRVTCPRCLALLARAAQEASR